MPTILHHPLVTHKLTQMRRKQTGTKDFPPES
jgi:uracil phosphoribosyltransferase